MSVSAEYKEWLLEQLGRVRPVTARQMFGGVGIYVEDAFFALLDNDTLFFKVDDTTRPDYEARGMKPFQPFGEGTRAMGGYYEVPVDVLERIELLEVWMGKAVRMAEAKAHANARKIRLGASLSAPRGRPRPSASVPRTRPPARARRR